MSANRISRLGIVAVLCLATRATSAPLPPRPDINPALLYWQAFSLYPQLSESDTKLLRESGPGSNPGAVALATSFDDAFRLIERAAGSSATCDWGMDLSDGPAAFVPSVPKIRTGAAAALLRARVALDRGDDLDTVRNLKLALWMARHAATDGSLVTVLIQLAIEDQIIEFVAGEFGRFSPDTLKALEAGFAEAPARVPVARSVAVEKACFLDWFVAQVLRARAEHSHDDAAALAAVGQRWAQIFSDEGTDATFEKVVAAGGGTIDGLLAYAKGVEPRYAELASLAVASPQELQPGASRLPRNLIADRALPNVRRARIREIELVTRSSMLRAAIARRIGGETAFERVHEPYGKGLFQVRPVTGGFELRSAIADAGLNGMLVVKEPVASR